MTDSKLYDQWYGFDWDLIIYSWGVGPDPDFILSSFTSEQCGYWSDTCYANPEYDRLYKEQQAALDPDERQAIVYEMQQIMYETSRRSSCGTRTPSKPGVPIDGRDAALARARRGGFWGNPYSMMTIRTRDRTTSARAPTAASRRASGSRGARSPRWSGGSSWSGGVEASTTPRDRSLPSADGVALRRPQVAAGVVHPVVHHHRELLPVPDHAERPGPAPHPAARGAALPEAQQAKIEELGLHLPLPTQYLRYLGDTVRLDFGDSFIYPGVSDHGVPAGHVEDPGARGNRHGADDRDRCVPRDPRRVEARTSPWTGRRWGSRSLFYRRPTSGSAWSC